MSVDLNDYSDKSGGREPPKKSQASEVAIHLASQEIAEALGRAHRVGREWVCLCPAHDDTDPSLWITDGKNGKPVFNCRAGCTQQAVIDALRRLGLWPSAAAERADPQHEVAHYSYHDAAGVLRYQVVRFGPKKKFKQRRPNGSPDSYIWNMDGVEPLPYRLPDLLSRPDAVVYVVEGEKDVDNIYGRLGLVATCNHGGAGKWRPEISQWLAGRHVVILPDNDAAGRSHAQDVAQKLSGIVASVGILELPGLPPKGDVSDWIAAGGTREQLERLVDEPTQAPSSSPSSSAQKILVDIDAPFSVAKVFVSRFFTESELPKIHYHKDVFHIWNGSSYSEMELPELTAGLYHFLERCETIDKKGRDKPIKPNKTIVSDVLHALKAAAYLYGNVSAPAWLYGLQTINPKPSEIIACRNGLLHLPSMRLIPHMPSYFNLNSLEFDYVASNSEPAEFKRFLHTLWENDEESISVLQEIFGYFLVPDTSQQKLFLLIGPPRSGKGTIATILKQLIGVQNHVAPTLASLGTEFGLQSLIGKMVAIIGDARIGGKADQQIIAERLLSISGEDSITVPRKYLTAWTGQMFIKFLIVSNELPYIVDKSGALASRYVILELQNSFLGREDLTLKQKILPELPLILNWAIKGWHRLHKRGYFVEPTSSQEAKREIEDLSSPIKAFIRERCAVGPGFSVGVNRIFEVWCEWCRTQGRDHPGNVQSFGRDLRAAVPGLRVGQKRIETGGQVRAYEGIKLKY